MTQAVLYCQSSTSSYSWKWGGYLGTLETAQFTVLQCWMTREVPSWRSSISTSRLRGANASGNCLRRIWDIAVFFCASTSWFVTTSHHGQPGSTNVIGGYSKFQSLDLLLARSVVFLSSQLVNPRDNDQTSWPFSRIFSLGIGLTSIIIMYLMGLTSLSKYGL